MDIKPVAYIYTDFTEKFGIPRQSGRAPSLTGRIVFESDYKSELAIRGIEQFSHLWLIFGFSNADRTRPSLTVRPPRLGGNIRIGVFASRSPFRPNSLGLSVVKLEGIEHTEKDGIVLNVSGVDILNETPIYDIKPYLPYADIKNDAVGGYGDELSTHSLNVVFPNSLLEKLPTQKRQAALECLQDDPRPSYHDDDRTYSMAFAGYDIHFKVQHGILTVFSVEQKTDCF